MSTFSKRLFPILGLLMVLLLSSCGKKSNDLTVVFSKLGAADCAILMTEDHTVVIDAGEAEDAEPLSAGAAELLELPPQAARDSSMHPDRSSADSFFSFIVCDLLRS